MKILFTGMASSHCKKPSNVSFFTLLSDVLSKDHDIVWASPSMSWKKEDLDRYDQIFFGLTPPTSLSANKLYGALNVLGLMFDSPKLKIVLDSPQIWQFKNSISAVTKDSSILFSSFYSRREGYEAASRNKSIVERATAHMLVSVWPKIIYPSVPWLSAEQLASLLGFVSAENLYGINLDPIYIDPEPARIGRRDYWALENPKSTWIESVKKSIVFPQEPTKVGRKTDDLYALDVIRNSVGLLLPPQERNSTVWWNYRLIQAMNTSTPIATYWQQTQEFSPSWSMLAYQIEDMSTSQRQALASAQRNTYLDSLPSPDEIRENLNNFLLDFSIERV